MTIQQNYPAIKPTLNLDFANTKQLDPRITYSRASTGTYYDGKAVAKAEENLLLYSQEFDNAVWTKTRTTVVANGTVAPDGTTTADKLVEDTSTTTHFAAEGVSVTSGAVYTYTVFVKAAERSYIGVYAGSLGQGVIFNLGTGTFSANLIAAPTSYSITSVGNGWYRCSITYTTSSSSTSPSVYLCDNTGAFSYTGDGTSGIYLWGAQLEQRSFATAYLPTTTAPITNYIPVLQTASAGTPRFDHNPITGESLGLLIEEQRTNLLTYSSDFDNPAWTASALNMATTQANALVSPDGTLTADKIIPTTTNAVHRISQSVTVTATTHTYTVFAKSGEYTSLALQMYDNTAGTTRALSSFNLLTGVATPTVGTASITAVGNGWFRCTVVSAATHAAGATLCWVFPDTTSSFAGNGFSGIYIWGAQLETGAFATSYIPTALTYSGRASAGTFRAPNGLIQTAAINAPRYEVNAGGGSNLLLENASSNLLTYTENFDNDVWGKNRVIAVSNQVAAPDGSSTADILTATTGTSDSIYQAVSVSNAVHTISFWIKGVGNTNSAAFGVITSGFIASTATVLSGPGTASGTTFLTITGLSEKEWTRVSFTTNAAFGAGICGFYIYPGGGNTANASVALWGAQFELGSTATSYIPSLETWTGRASTATYYDSTGIIRTAASGQPRYSYNPSLLSVAPKLLLEAQGTNLLTFSEQFDNAAWIKGSSTIAANTTAAPDGTLTADTLTAAAANSFAYQVFSAAAATYTFSVWIKSVSVGTSLELNLYTNTGASSVGAAVVTTTGSWQRVSVTGVFASASASAWATIGGNASFSTGETIYIWGAQLEAGSSATSYIPTAASQVTRVADTSTSAAQSRAADVYSSSQVTRAVDSASMTGTNFSSWYNQSEGTLYCAADSNVANLGSYAYFVSDSLGNNYYRATNNTTTLSLQSGAAGSNVVNLDAVQAGMITGISYPNAYAYQRGSFAGVVRNGTVRTSANTTMPLNLNQMAIGSSGFGGAQINGHVQRISYYPRRLTNTQIQALTT